MCWNHAKSPTFETIHEYSRPVVFCEYKGTADLTGKPIGHSSKALKEYSSCLRAADKSVDLRFAGCANYAGVVDIPVEMILDEYCVISRKDSIDNRGICARNISLLLEKYRNENCVLWFYNCDFFLMPELAKLGKHKCKIVLTLYTDNYSSKSIIKNAIKHIIVAKALSHVDLIIWTSKKLAQRHRGLFVPDYLYNKKRYAKVSKESRNDIVCVGTMGDKDFAGLINLFCRTDHRLLIAGYFYDKTFAENLRKQAPANVKIEDRYLSEDEYESLIAGARYVILPYKTEFYKDRTSGVLLECAFFRTPTIAPKDLYETTDGVGYEYENIEAFDVAKLDNDFDPSLFDVIIDSYDVTRIGNVLSDAISRV